MSRAFMYPESLEHHIHRPPQGPGWELEESAYDRHPPLTPDFVYAMKISRRLMAWFDVPTRTVWIKPADGSWEALEEQARLWIQM